MGSETGSLYLLAPLLLTGGKRANLVIRGNVVLNTLSTRYTSTLLRDRICINSPSSRQVLRPIRTVLRDRLRFIYVIERDVISGLDLQSTSDLLCYRGEKSTVPEQYSPARQLVPSERQPEVVRHSVTNPGASRVRCCFRRRPASRGRHGLHHAGTWHHFLERGHGLATPCAWEEAQPGNLQTFSNVVILGSLLWTRGGEQLTAVANQSGQSGWNYKPTLTRSWPRNVCAPGERLHEHDHSCSQEKRLLENGFWLDENPLELCGLERLKRKKRKVQNIPCDIITPCVQ